MGTTITTAVIPKQVPKAVRARLMRMQFEKVRAQMGKHWFVWEPQTMKAVVPYDTRLNPCALTKDFAQAMSRTEIHWVISCYIMSRETNGKLHLTEEVLNIKTPCKHSDISRAAADYHWHMIEEFKASRKAPDFITAGWIANTKSSPTLEDAVELFRIVGAWDLPSDREESVNN